MPDKEVFTSGIPFCALLFVLSPLRNRTLPFTVQPLTHLPNVISWRQKETTSYPWTWIHILKLVLTRDDLFRYKKNCNVCQGHLFKNFPYFFAQVTEWHLQCTRLVRLFRFSYIILPLASRKKQRKQFTSVVLHTPVSSKIISFSCGWQL